MTNKAQCNRHQAKFHLDNGTIPTTTQATPVVPAHTPPLQSNRIQNATHTALLALPPIPTQVVNFGKEVDVACYVLMLPLLKEQKYITSDDLSWTIVGSEYDHLAHDGTLQTIYNIPINMQEQPGIMQVNNVDGQAQPPIDDDTEDGLLDRIL
jgi:hypothetical protein